MVARWYLCAECGGTWPASAVVVVVVVVAMECELLRFDR